MRRSEEAAWRVEQFWAFAVIAVALVLADLLLGAASSLPVA